MITFLSTSKFKKTRDSLNVIFFSNKDKFNEMLKSLNIKNWNPTSIYVINGYKHQFILIKDDSWFLDLSSIKITKDEQLIFIHLSPLKVDFKKACMNILFKRTYLYEKMIHKDSRKKIDHIIVDKVKHKALIKDYINRVECMNWARDLATMPTNMTHPDHLCEMIVKGMDIDGNKRVSVEVFDEHKMKKLGMNLILGVGGSSKYQPRLLIINYKCAKDNKTSKKHVKTICLCGKGVIFDSGGYNMKDSKNMDGMKGDKTGGVIVCGIMKYLIHHQKDLDYNVVAVIPFVENLVSHKALVPGDIVRAYNGKTVEITNTDAEGRLILADALSYACDRFKPDYVLDFATLTGWATILHCATSYVFYTPSEELARSVFENGEENGERSIRMPNWPEYEVFVKSEVADLKNANYECKSGGFMASMFLSNFVPKHLHKRWVHFDITHSEKGSLQLCNSFATGVDMLLKGI